MKFHFFLFLLFAASSLSLTSCQTRKAVEDDGRTEGINASETGYTRDKVYEWQDRTFRQLAY